MEKYVVRCYQGQKIRSVWKEREGRWFFSVVDVLRALDVSANPSRYWSDLKRKLRQKTEKEEVLFRFENIVSLKLPAADQKNYKTDMLDEEGLKELFAILHIRKTEEFLDVFFHAEKTERTRRAEGKTEKSGRLLPLLNSSFEPGNGKKTVESFSDPDLQRIAEAELYYFSGEAEKCEEITETYLENENISIRLSACLMYSFANFTLGNAEAARNGFLKIQETLAAVLSGNEKKEIQANCVFAGYMTCILVHLPADDLPPLREYVKYLPKGLRAYASYLMAHELYLKENYERALGILDATLFSLNETYPIPEIYIYCMVAMCKIKLKETEEAKEAFMTAWDTAKPDGLLEVFIEHHGLLQGVMESCLKKAEPEAYKALTKGIISFSRGWMKIHNQESDWVVTDALTPQEFAIAMLACRDWSNQEIADCMGLSVNTVKHIISDILATLHVNSRKELLQFVNK